MGWWMSILGGCLFRVPAGFSAQQETIVPETFSDQPYISRQQRTYIIAVRTIEIKRLLQRRRRVRNRSESPQIVLARRVEHERVGQDDISSFPSQLHQIRPALSPSHPSSENITHLGKPLALLYPKRILRPIHPHRCPLRMIMQIPNNVIQPILANIGSSSVVY